MPTAVLCDDSIQAMGRLAAGSPRSIDLIYLGSYDIDWQNLLPAAMQALKPGALVVVDDHRSAKGLPGKSFYVADFLRDIRARLLFEEYQIG